MPTFFKRLNYSFGNEDWNTEHRALKIRAGDRVLCITASGDRSLHVLLDNPKEVISVDANPLQNSLLNLKMLAMQQLDYKTYLSFLGATPGHNRSVCLDLLLKSMDAEARDFWQKQRPAIERGILYQGVIESITRKSAMICRLLRPNKVNQLFKIRDLKEQQSFVRKKWDTFLWRKAFDIGLHPVVNRFFNDDPGLVAHVPSSLHIGSFIYGRMLNCLNRHLACESSLVSLILKGEVGAEAFPPYLTSKGIQEIRKRLDRVKCKTANVIDYLEEAPDNYFDAFSLSDIASYMSEHDFVRLSHAVHRTAKPGARFSMRQFLTFRQIPASLREVFHRDEDLEHQLEEEDRCFVYRFFVGKIAK